MLLLLGLGACGGGGGGGGAGVTAGAGEFAAATQGEASTTQQGPVRGLPNLGASCYINAVLQIVVNDPRLRAAAIENNPGIDFQGFFDAYDFGDQAKLETRHQAVVAGIQGLPGMAGPGLPGSPLDVWLGTGADTGNSGLRLPYLWVGDPGSIDPDLGRDGDAFIFEVLPRGAAGNIITAAFDALPAPERISGLIDNSGGHYQSYLRRDAGGWWVADDGRIDVISEQDVHNLSADATHGIELVIYRPA